MDTPDNNNNKIQSNSSILSKFEDSPVFNYISTLSPIKQFSVNHNAQSFHLLSFTSPRSLQTPPPINYPKESNITSVNNALDASLNNSSENDDKGRNADISDSAQPCDLLDEACDKSNSGREVYSTKPNEPQKLVNELRVVKYECCSPESNVECSGAANLDCEFNVVGTEAFPENVIQNAPEGEQTSPENLMDMQTFEVELHKELCDWDKFISEASDLFKAHSPTEGTDNEDHTQDSNDDSATLSFIRDFLQTPTANIDDSKKMGSLSRLNSSAKHDEPAKPDETSQVSTLRACSVHSKEFVPHADTQVDDKEPQTTSRRLIYEMPGSHYGKMLSGSIGGSSVSNSTASPNTSNHKCLVASKSGKSKFSSVLPGIGLHLNALAAAGRENKIIVKRKTLTCRRQLISTPSTMSSFDPLIPDMENPNRPLTSEVIESACEIQMDDKSLNENACENSSFGEGIGLPESSPKKKRKKQDDVGDINSCKRCNCKKSKCLKLYCECFAAGLYCVEPCNCQDCFNKPAHEDIVLETRQQIVTRNPLAFAPKVVMCSATPKSLTELNKTPASARHKRGCNCKKSGCLKKYCECFQGGVGCSQSCRCEACKNTFGRKEGDGFVFEEAIRLQKSAADITSHEEVSKADSEDLSTPQPTYDERQLVRRPFHFDAATPESDSLPGEQPPQSYTSQKTDDSNHTCMVEKHDLVQDGEASALFEDDYLLPATNVKSTSPNCKRISSDHHEVETSLGWKSCRKLILRSIPSFSTVKQESSEMGGKLE